MNKLYSIFNKNHTSSKINYSRDNIFKIEDKSKCINSTQSGSNNTDLTYQNPSINVISSSNQKVFFDIIEHIKDKDYKENYLRELKDTILNQKINNHIFKPVGKNNREKNS